MHTLVFDTTANGTIIGLYEDDKCLSKVEEIMEFGQAEKLAVGVKSMLDDAKLSFSNIDLLGVCVGPGSFTGVRAGIAFARGLALGNPKMAITGVSAFEIYANMLKDENRAIYNAVVIETKREDFYFQLFDEKLQKISEPSAFTRDEIAKIIKSHQTSFIGDGVERFLSVSMGLQIKDVDFRTLIDVDALFEATKEKYFAKKLDFPKPLYIRGADACVK